MKIALINPFRFQEGLLKKNEPISLNYLKTYLVNRGYFVEIFDYEIIENSELEFIVTHIANEYDVVGISCYYPYLPNHLAKKIKEINSSIIIIAGGPMASLSYKELIGEESFVDYVVVNEGEESLYDLVVHLNAGIKPYSVPGIASYFNGSINYTPRPFIIDLDNVDFPIREQGYFNNYIPSIISSRGCNGRCRFCSTRYMGKWRGRSPEHVAAEILHIVKEHNETHFQFVDPNFLEDIDRAVKIVELLKPIERKISFDFACRVDSIIDNQDKLTIIKKAGAIKVLLGIENFDDETLKSWLKDITLQQICNAIAILNDVGLNYSISLILFHPSVTLESLIKNITIIDKLNIVNKIENIFNYLRLIPGTAMNLSSTTEVWSFADKEVEKIFKNCLIYEKRQEEKINTFALDVNYVKNNIDEFAELTYYLGNKKVMNFNFLKKELGIDEKELKYTVQLKKSHMKLVINPNIEIRYIAKDKLYQSLNTNTGLIYSFNKTAMFLINISQEKTLIEIINYIDVNFNNDESIYINDFINGLISLIANQILIWERI